MTDQEGYDNKNNERDEEQQQDPRSQNRSSAFGDNIEVAGSLSYGITIKSRNGREYPVMIVVAESENVIEFIKEALEKRRKDKKDIEDYCQWEWDGNRWIRVCNLRSDDSNFEA